MNTDGPASQVMPLEREIELSYRIQGRHKDMHVATRSGYTVSSPRSLESTESPTRSHFFEARQTFANRMTTACLRPNISQYVKFVNQPGPFVMFVKQPFHLWRPTIIRQNSSKHSKMTNSSFSMLYIC